ncbi:hypothetical protein DPMN_166279 [Dreissena polymorpha]|uniref:Uncharacterized protein n=1 Tax=Dreissena polymorpha TaxID=45954 RepID=A0A9D4F298_DREPO|nr:hypothetical protein DPMN_166279 [Dreissena polymorpha]
MQAVEKVVYQESTIIGSTNTYVSSSGVRHSNIDRRIYGEEFQEASKESACTALAASYSFHIPLLLKALSPKSGMQTIKSVEPVWKSSQVRSGVQTMQ